MWNVTNKYIVVINNGTDVTNNGTNKLEIDTNKIWADRQRHAIFVVDFQPSQIPPPDYLRKSYGTRTC